MIICICHRISDRDIAQAARDGCASFDDLQIDLGVATACGKCHDCARQTFHQHAGPATQAAGAAAAPYPHGRHIPVGVTVDMLHTTRHSAAAGAVG